MNKIRNITREYKGVVSFLLLFVFLYSGLIRNAIIDVPSLVAIETQHVSTSFSKQKQLTAISDEDLSQRQLAQFKKGDNDADDELVFSRNYLITNKSTDVSTTKSAITQMDLFHSVAKPPLYDLFCNWKFHLS